VVNLSIPSGKEPSAASVAMNRRFGGPQSLFGFFGEEKILLVLP